MSLLVNAIHPNHLPAQLSLCLGYNSKATKFQTQTNQQVNVYSRRNANEIKETKKENHAMSPHSLPQGKHPRGQSTDSGSIPPYWIHDGPSLAWESRPRRLIGPRDLPCACKRERCNVRRTEMHRERGVPRIGFSPPSRCRGEVRDRRGTLAVRMRIVRGRRFS